jgi:hypothetical protein
MATMTMNAIDIVPTNIWGTIVVNPEWYYEISIACYGSCGQNTFYTLGTPNGSMYYRVEMAQSTVSATTLAAPPCAIHVDAEAPSLVGVGLKAKFSATTKLTAECGGMLSATWRFGDATKNASGLSTSHTYSRLGDYAWTVTVTSRSGATSTDTGVMHVVRTYTLSGVTSITNGTDRWPLDGAGMIIRATAVSVTTGLSFRSQPALAAAYTLALAEDVYDLFYTLQYSENITVDNRDTCGKTYGCDAATVNRVVTRGPERVHLTGVMRHDLLVPPPIVLVHGINSCFTTWNAWGSYARSRGFITLTPNYHWNIGDGWGSSANEVQLHVLSHFGRWLSTISSVYPTWVYIGHSQGGLIGRVLAASHDASSPLIGALSKMYLFGTPNSGTSNGGSGAICVGHLSEDAIQNAFNVTYPDFGAASVYAVAGVKYCVLGVCGDGVVGAASVLNIRSRDCPDCVLKTLALPGSTAPYSHTGLISNAAAPELFFPVLAEVALASGLTVRP